jgi:peroxiredoxin Q/BCP
MAELKVGDLAPDFKGDSTEGELSLDRFKGHNIVLYFYPKDMTPGCTIQAQEFSKLYPKFQSLNTAVIGISRDSLALHKKFCDQEKIPYPLLLDQDSEVCNKYGVIKQKSMFSKTFLGINRTTFLIDKHKKIAKVWHSVKPLGHAEEVLDAIKTLG